MRLLTFSTQSEPRLGAEWNHQIVDLQNALALCRAATRGAQAAAEVPQLFPAEMLALIRAGDAGMALAGEALEFLQGLPDTVLASLKGSILFSEDEVRRHAPIPRPPKVVCVGLNYRDHAIESGLPIPQEPVLFSKYPTSVIGPGDPIILPPSSQEPDYEAELVFIIGKGGRNIAEADAMSHVFGYTCGHDVSARDYQIKRGGGQWMVGKTWDTFAPLGPALVTADEGLDPHNLPIRCVVNGEVLQNSNTNQFIFTIPQVIAYLSHFMTLEPGDVVFTGTPPGVGFARKPPIYLKDGDVTEIQIDGIGTLRNPVRLGS